jgi:hypothetical protein
MLIVEVCYRLPEGLDSSSRPIFSSMIGNMHLLGPVEAPLDTVVHLGRSLTQVGPLIGVFEEAVLVGALGSPDYTGGGAGRVEAGVRFVAFV